MSVHVLSCSCPHGYQDVRYGVGNRLHNHAPSNSGNASRYRCTVCGTTRDLGGGVKPKFEGVTKK